MRSTATLAKEVERLRSRRPSMRRAVPRDPVEFAKELGFVCDPWQEEFLRSDAPRVLLNCSRQSGKSTTTGILALHTALMRPGALVLILSPSERQSVELFAKVGGFYRLLGYAPSADSNRKSGMELANRSRIEALPGTSDRTVRGFSGVDLLVIDEASRVLDDLYYALRPMLAVSGGRLVALSTPFGKRGWWYEAWSSGMEWERYEVPAYMCPRISPEFVEEERRSLPARVYRQEYECSFEEAEGQVFSEASIQAAITDHVEPLLFFEEAS